MFVIELQYFVKPVNNEIVEEHVRFLRKLFEEGKFRLAGKLVDNTDIPPSWPSPGLIVWETSSVEEARKLSSDDPFFQKGYITFVLKGWNLFWNSFVTPKITPKSISDLSSILQ